MIGRDGQFRISLCITTYNSVLRLQQVFKSLIRMRHLPEEILICDDGSGQATRELVQWFSTQISIPVHHLWQPDCGWRPSRARNNGIQHSIGDYIVFIDGDCVPHARFVLDHRRLAKVGTLVLGDRAHVREEALQTFTPSLSHILMEMWRRRIHKRRSALRVFWERPERLRFDNLTYRQLAHLAVGCNFAAWRSNLLQVNGFNEAITGWGLEDVELIARIMATGVEARKVRRKAIVYHLDHGDRAYDSEAVLKPVEAVFRERRVLSPAGIVKQGGLLR